MFEEFSKNITTMYSISNTFQTREWLYYVIQPFRTFESFFLRIPVVVISSFVITHAVHVKKKKDAEASNSFVL